MKPVVINKPVEGAFHQIMAIVDSSEEKDSPVKTEEYLRQILRVLKKLYQRGATDVIKEINPN